MGAGWYQWTVVIIDGKISVSRVDDLYEYPFAIISCHGDNEQDAKLAAYELAEKAGLQILRLNKDNKI